MNLIYRKIAGASLLVLAFVIAAVVIRNDAKKEVYAEWQAATAKAEQEAHAKERELINVINDIDMQHYEELENAKKDNDSLRNDLASSSKRVYIKAKCSNLPQKTTPSGVDHAETTAELDPATAAALAGIAADGDEAIRKLTFLQEYVSID